MRSRWFHIPRFHVPVENHEKRVTWLELFYDLIFVAAFIQLGNGLGHHISIGTILAFISIFVCLWVSWTGFSLFSNRYSVDDFLHRVMVFVQMFGVAVMAVSVPEVMHGHATVFSLAYGFVQLNIAALYIRSYRTQPIGRVYAKFWSRIFLAGAAIWTISAVVPAPWNYGCWFAGVGVLAIAPFFSSAQRIFRLYPTDRKHLRERYGLLTLIVLGESFVKVVSSFSDAPSMGNIMRTVILILITCCIWWLYFDDVSQSKPKPLRHATPIWLYTHMPLQLCLVALGVGLKWVLHEPLMGTVSGEGAAVLGIALGGVLLCVATINSITSRPQSELSDQFRVYVRLGAGLLLILLGLACRSLATSWVLLIFAALMVSQVLFDMVMAPIEDNEPEPVVKGAELARLSRRPSEASQPGGRARIGQAVRRGTPSELQKDLYFFLIEGSWLRLISFLGGGFLFTNFVFAALYYLIPSSIAADAPVTIWDAFNFSVQTISTIGFGHITPESPVGNLLVMVEALVGLLGMAAGTGLFFAKLSRPKVKILFSKPIIITQRHGKKILTFRVGNTAGNDIADATITMSVLRDDISPEGDHIRRIIDLKLTRDRSAFFALTWAVMHELDETSPLKDVDWSNPGAEFLVITVSLIGHDTVYNQTIHTRHAYYPEDIRYGYRFIDVIGQLPTGQMLIDFEKFHAIEPESTPRTPVQ